LHPAARAGPEALRNEPAVIELCISHQEHTNMEKIDIKVSGLTCGGCERSVQNALTSRKGVSAAKADRNAGIVSVEFDPAVIQRPALEKAIAEAGFKVAA